MYKNICWRLPSPHDPQKIQQQERESSCSMAISVSSNCYPSLPSISLCAIPSLQVQTLQPLPPSLSLFSEDCLTIAAALQAVTLANAAAKAASDAASSALALSEMAFPLEVQLGKEARVPSKRRKRKRKAAAVGLDSNRKTPCFEQFSVKSAGSGYLSSREEAECSLFLKEGARLEATRNKIREASDCDPTMSQWAKAAGMKKGSLEKLLSRIRVCKDRITRSYKRLVVSIATPYIGRGLSLHDLIQEGCIGLLRGAERFDHSKGNKLSTYVYWWIKQAILKAVATKSRIVRLPVSMQVPVAQVSEASIILSSRLGRSPCPEEVAAEANLSISEVKLVIQRTRFPLSLDRPMSDRGSITTKEIIPGPAELAPEAMVEGEWMKRDVARLLGMLTEREEYIVRLYFGLNGETCKSFEEIGRSLNLSRERVRQVHYIALEKLQETASVDHLRVYIT